MLCNTVQVLAISKSSKSNLTTVAVCGGPFFSLKLLVRGGGGMVVRGTYC